MCFPRNRPARPAPLGRFTASPSKCYTLRGPGAFLLGPGCASHRSTPEIPPREIVPDLSHPVMPLSRLRRHIAAPIVLAAALFLLNASVAFAQTPTAQEIIRSHGCPGCHVIPGIPEAQGHIGPTLEGVGSRPRIAS